jgi:hypothetical protein
MLIGVAPLTAAAQEVGPPVVEYKGRGMGSFEVRNNGLFPMNVVIEPFGFVQDSLGKITYVPFDAERVKLRLSAMSLRLPPRASLSVSYEATSDSVPAWFVITSTFHGTRRQGVNYNFQLPHVVYLHQKTAVRSDELQLTDLSFDKTARQARFRMRNASAGLTRCAEGVLSGPGGARAPIAAFPLFPRFDRWVTVDWPHSSAPTRVRLLCSGGELTFDRPPATGGAP